MRVLHFRSSFTFAGPEAVLLNFAVPLRRCGVETKVIVHYQRKGGEPRRHRLVQELTRRGLNAEQWDCGRFVSPHVLGRLTRELLDGRFDLLHTHDPQSNLMGLIAASRAGVPVVATVHLHDTSSVRARIYRAADLLTLRFFPGVIAVSNALKEELIAARLTAAKIRVIHNGIDGERFGEGAAERAETWRAKHGHPGGGKIVTTVGRLHPQKGMHAFLEAARLILQEQPQTRFWVAGDGPLRCELEWTARRLGIEHATVFLGHQSDVAGIMAASDVIAVASVREGLPMVVLEALALGRPVVATAVGGIPEVIQDNISGWLVPSDEPALLAGRILKTMEHTGEAGAVGARGAVHIAEEFSARAGAHLLAESYAELLSAAKTRGIEEMAIENQLG